MHEILLGMSAGTGAQLKFGNSNTRINISAGYNYTVAPGWQVGIVGNLANNAAGTSWSARAQLTANFPMESDLKDAIFLFVNFGLNDTGTSSDPILAAGLGKRFEIVQNVSWRPNVGIEKSFATGAGIDFVINVVEISALF